MILFTFLGTLDYFNLDIFLLSVSMGFINSLVTSNLFRIALCRLIEQSMGTGEYLSTFDVLSAVLGIALWGSDIGFGNDIYWLNTGGFLKRISPFVWITLLLGPAVTHSY